MPKSSPTTGGLSGDPVQLLENTPLSPAKVTSYGKYVKKGRRASHKWSPHLRFSPAHRAEK
jgi:hypothetical protein